MPQQAHERRSACATSFGPRRTGVCAATRTWWTKSCTDEHSTRHACPGKRTCHTHVLQSKRSAQARRWPQRVAAQSTQTLPTDQCSTRDESARYLCSYALEYPRYANGAHGHQKAEAHGHWSSLARFIQYGQARANTSTHAQPRAPTRTRTRCACT
eukprot:6187086-Pleurochrysis_carterae.AAC.1